jgi:flagellar basal-body rod modification protein FlgD
MQVSNREQVISTLNRRAADATATKSNTDQTVNKETFLTLLTTQLQYQDPLNPMEGIEFTQQLAQFSSLEQLMAVNEGIASLGSAFQTQNNFEAFGLVGREVKALGSVLNVSEGESSTGIFALEEAASSVEVYIYDADGKLVRSLDLGSQASGEHEIEWDGLDKDGNPVDDGTYSFMVSAADAEGEALSVMTAIEGEVSGVTFDSSGNAVLVVNNQTVSLDSIIEIYDDSPSEETES